MHVEPGDDTVAVFAINARAGAVPRQVSTDGRSPRHFRDRRKAGGSSSRIKGQIRSWLQIDAKTGIPLHVGSIATIPSPVDIVFVRQ
jgi:hypothetical protein